MSGHMSTGTSGHSASSTVRACREADQLGTGSAPRTTTVRTMTTGTGAGKIAEAAATSAVMEADAATKAETGVSTNDAFTVTAGRTTGVPGGRLGAAASSTTPRHPGADAPAVL